MMKGRGLIVVYILCVWFVISFVTNLIGPLMPIIIGDFRLESRRSRVSCRSHSFSRTAIVSIPAGMHGGEPSARRRHCSRRSLLNLLGALAIALLPRVSRRDRRPCSSSALGMAMLQVVINPLMRTAGGEAHFAFFSVMGQLVFGLASFLSPLAFSALMQNFAEGTRPDGGILGPLATLVPASLPWVSFYWAFAAIFVLVIVDHARHAHSKDRAEGRRASRNTRSLLASCSRDRHVRLFFLGIVAYVGTEQSLANWMSQFLSTYHGMSRRQWRAHRRSRLFWGSDVGGLRARPVVAASCSIRESCSACFPASQWSASRSRFSAPSETRAACAFPLSGFFLSVMFSVIFSLALNSVPRHHGALSGILCTGILGGAVVPLLVGVLGDWFGLRVALTRVFVTVGYILSISFWADPIVRNDTVNVMKILRPSKQS